MTTENITKQPITIFMHDYEELDVSEFNMSMAIGGKSDAYGTLLYYAFKELKALRSRLDKLENQPTKRKDK